MVLAWSPRYLYLRKLHSIVNKLQQIWTEQLARM